jgi:ankyrin repeat protein
MKHLFYHCQDIFRNQVVATYFFNARGDSLEKTPLGMLRSLLYQLLDQDCHLYERFVPVFREKVQVLEGFERTDVEWLEAELVNYLLREIRACTQRPVLLLIDALDECKESEVEKVVEFLELLSLKAIGANVTMNICLSSRHYPNVGIDRALELIVEQREEHRQDIVLYVSHKLKKKDAMIEDRILKKASGVFMWVVLVITMLNRAYNRGQVEAMHETLDRIPSDLEQVFHSLLNEDGSDRPEMILILQLVLFTKRPLRPLELYFAVLAGTAAQMLGDWRQWRITDDDILRRITNSSRGLIEVRKESGSLQFIHESVHDFLLRHQRLQTLDPGLESNPIGTSHDRLRECCLSYLTINSLTLLDTLPMDRPASKMLCYLYPFISYACIYIFEHAEEAQRRGIDQKCFLQLLQDRDDVFSRLRFFHSSMTNKPIPMHIKYAKLLRFLFFHGYRELAIVQLTSGSSYLNAQSDYSDALEETVMRGDKAMTKLLLAKGANVNAKIRHYSSPLQVAIVLEKEEIATMLLEEGADVKVESSIYGNALQAATIVGSETMVKTLLRKGADVNGGGGLYGSSLMAAIVLDKGPIVRILVEEGADVDKRGGFYDNPLQAAVRQGNKEVVEMLLQNGANVNIQGGPYGHALRAALRGLPVLYWDLKPLAFQPREDQDILVMLLENGADVDAHVLGGRCAKIFQRAAAHIRKGVLRTSGKGPSIIGSDDIHDSVKDDSIIVFGPRQFRIAGFYSCRQPILGTQSLFCPFSVGLWAQVLRCHARSNTAIVVEEVEYPPG